MAILAPSILLLESSYCLNQPIEKRQDEKKSQF